MLFCTPPLWFLALVINIAWPASRRLHKTTSSALIMLKNSSHRASIEILIHTYILYGLAIYCTLVQPLALLCVLTQHKSSAAVFSLFFSTRFFFCFTCTRALRRLFFFHVGKAKPLFIFFLVFFFFELIIVLFSLRLKF